MPMCSCSSLVTLSARRSVLPRGSNSSSRLSAPFLSCVQTSISSWHQHANTTKCKTAAHFDSPGRVYSDSESSPPAETPTFPSASVSPVGKLPRASCAWVEPWSRWASCVKGSRGVVSLREELKKAEGSWGDGAGRLGDRLSSSSLMTLHSSMRSDTGTE
ncbi:hypothetical protein F7725_013966 [Dissostichus mawsoni]|uniref:Uncharacterized protein n=1 Tax=Dissostichus mawsoni TaxID=36200 RepID=A0A7J5YYY2_DISMA|nr:hypothetical protein F7725_013966 [Dissostichus mawsoni]